MLSAMPADINRSVKRFRRLYDVGLHGPDLLFYYRPMLTNKVQKLGSRFHRQTGREFFSRVCRNLRLEPSEAANAYLYGVLCHYSLDSACHPLVIEKSRDGILGHTQIETEFDRFLMERDGKPEPHREHLTNHIRLTAGECDVVSRFYPGVEARHIRTSLKDMVALRKLLAAPEGSAGQWLQKLVSAASDEFHAMRIKPEADVQCEELNPLLMERYEQAADRFPERLLQLNAHLTYNAPLGEDFAPIFG